jgi:hypothetical protein
MDNPTEIEQLDRVQVLTTKNVQYVSDRLGIKPDPHGTWSVVGFVEKEALLAKGTALIRIPVKDIRKVGEYDRSIVIRKVERLIEELHGGKKDKTEDDRPS